MVTQSLLLEVMVSHILIKERKRVKVEVLVNLLHTTVV